MSNSNHDRLSSRGTSSSDRKQHKPHKSSSHKSSRGRTSESGSSSSRPANVGMSFLFVANKLEIPDLEYGSPIEHDRWHNSLPPKAPQYYAAEYSSKVMRFANGKITDASGSYQWRRDQPFVEGYMQHRSTGYVAEKYKSASVFSCNPLLPIVTIDGDARTQMDPTLHPLRFFHPRYEGTINGNGVSQVTFSHLHEPVQGAPPQNSMMVGYMAHVAGKSASWMPGLVPSVFRNPYPNPGRSVGLGGELPILIGLMAFHAHQDRSIEELFLGSHGRSGAWHDYRWNGSHTPPGYVCSADDSPSGYYVHICLDPENVQGSTLASLSRLEWNSVLVGEPA